MSKKVIVEHIVTRVGNQRSVKFPLFHIPGVGTRAWSEIDFPYTTPETTFTSNKSNSRSHLKSREYGKYEVTIPDNVSVEHIWHN